MFFPVSAVEIENEITRLNSSKASGPFSIPVWLLKLLKTCISFPLEFIYNLSFSSGCVPDQLKLADIITVHKKDSVTCMNNYRPISLLSIFNKILEKLVYKRLITFIDKYNILLLVFSVMPFKIDQNQNQNRPIDKVQNLGNERRYIYKDPRQDSGQRNISYTRYPKKCFTQIYRDLYGDAMLVLTWMSSNMADGNQQKHLLPNFATKA